MGYTVKVNVMISMWLCPSIQLNRQQHTHYSVSTLIAAYWIMSIFVSWKLRWCYYHYVSYNLNTTSWCIPLHSTMQPQKSMRNYDNKTVKFIYDQKLRMNLTPEKSSGQRLKKMPSLPTLHNMMTSKHVDALRIAGPMWGKSCGRSWFVLTKGQ